MNIDSLPVAVIGAGPIGLAAAAHLLQRGETPLILEAGSEVAANIRTWGHVPLFSPWRYLIDSASQALLEQTDWQTPNLDGLPTGDQLIDAYLQPLAATLQIKAHLHLTTRVTAISRRRIDKMKDAGRDNAPFALHVTSDGHEDILLARAVIDASGTWATPNPIGADGLFAPGERANQDRIFYGIPDVLGTEQVRYANKHVVVVGSGHSAINAILELADLKQQHPATQITWVLRKANVAATYGGLDADTLPGRGLLGIRIKQLVETGTVVVQTPLFVQRIETADGGLQIVADTSNGEQRINADEIVVATGARPDLSFLRELRLSLDNSVESTAALAPLIDPNIHSCGTVRPHGEKELRHPEQNFYIVGMKSYGRAPTFLLTTGYEQVRSVVAALVGDWEAAEKVELVLPETGVCGVPQPVDANGLQPAASFCCRPEPAAAVLANVNQFTADIPLLVTPGGCC